MSQRGHVWPVWLFCFCRSPISLKHQLKSTNAYKLCEELNKHDTNNLEWKEDRDWLASPISFSVTIPGSFIQWLKPLGVLKQLKEQRLIWFREFQNQWLMSCCQHYEFWDHWRLQRSSKMGLLILAELEKPYQMKRAGLPSQIFPVSEHAVFLRELLLNSWWTAFMSL